MRIVWALFLVVFVAACARPQPPPRPPARRAVAKAPLPPGNYLKTTGGGWRIKLTDDHRRVTACQYGLRVGPARRFDRTLYLRVVFENPLSASSPLITETKIEPWMHELAIKSPEVRGLRKGGRYSIRVHIFEDPGRKRWLGVHDQMMPARLNVNRDGSVKF